MGLVWVRLGQRGSKREKGENFVDFKTLFAVLKKYLSDGADVPEFMRTLISMITELFEEDWDVKRDPLGMVRDATLRNYAKRGLSKKFAKQVAYRLNRENMIAWIGGSDISNREMMAQDLLPYDPFVNADNVAEKVADWMTDCIRKLAGFVPAAEMNQQKQEKQASDLKSKYGNYLLAESDNHCPNCGRRLIISRNGETVPVYEVSIIDQSKDPEPQNLLAMCPNCAAVYQMDDDAKLQKELKAKKNILSTHEQSMELLEDLPLERGITGVVTRIKKLKEKDIAESMLDPKELTQKLDPSKDMAIYLSVKLYVTTYFNKIDQIMINLDKKKQIDYDEVQRQMNGMYRRLNKTKKSKAEIFNEISRKVQRVTLQEDVFCQIVVSYFIQKCEVF